MDIRELEKIEAYLSQRLSEGENSQFVKELKTSEELAEKTKSIAYILHSIHLIGLKRDNERIGKIYTTASGDYKRYITSIAAMLIVVLSFATIVSVPVYRHVVKPVLEKVFKKEPMPSQSSDSAVGMDTVTITIDEVSIDTLKTDSVTMRTKIESVPPVIKEKVEPIRPQEIVVKQDVSADTVVVKETEPDTIVREVVQVSPVKVEPPQPVNRIVSYSQLKNYWFGDVIAKREGKDVVCTFVMKNEVEDAEIQMHSARAKDGKGKNYLAKYCLLNGKSKRIVEKWEKGEEHIVTVTIVDVPLEVIEFESISFSFQSAGDSLKQKSQSIILKVGEIN